MASQVRLGSHLGHFGRLEERQGRVWAPTEPRKERQIHAGGRDPEGGALRRLQKPYQTAPGILARLNVPGGTVADYEETQGINLIVPNAANEHWSGLNVRTIIVYRRA